MLRNGALEANARVAQSRASCGRKGADQLPARGLLGAVHMVRVGNKRKHARYDGSGLWARVKIDGVFSEAHVENVSLGGALLGLRFACPTGKNVLLDLRGVQRDLRLVGRVIGVLPARSRKTTTLTGARVRFNAPGERTLDQLDALIRRLPVTHLRSAAPTFHELKLADTTTDDDDEVDFEIVHDTDEPTVPM